MCAAAPLAIGIGWYMLGDTMKKYPEDTLPSLAIQFVCFTVLFVTWILGDIGWKHGPAGIADWLGQVPAILQTPGAKSEFSWPRARWIEQGDVWGRVRGSAYLRGSRVSRVFPQGVSTSVHAFTFEFSPNPGAQIVFSV